LLFCCVVWFPATVLNIRCCAPPCTQEMDMVQRALSGRRLVMCELYKYYSWTPEKQGASRLAKLRMSPDNFIKLLTDAQVLSSSASSASSAGAGSVTPRSKPRGTLHLWPSAAGRWLLPGGGEGGLFCRHSLRC
jgi:hypothetical protein